VSGGNDFITKPFLFIELAVRALVYVYRHRLQPGVAF
jgi:DNA-binding response OmpR family regulator